MTPAVRPLLIINVAMFAVMALAGQAAGVAALVNGLVLVPALIPQRPWTIVTYAFLHADLMHLLVNMIGLFFFGPRLELELGKRHFLGLYFGSAIAAALASLLTPTAAVVGASGAVFGVLLGFARHWPHERIYLWGVLPLQARWLIVLLAVYSIWGGLTGGGGIAHFAHLGGIAGGWLYLKVLEHRSPARRFQKKASQDPGRVTSADIERWRSIPRDSLHPINRQELERILKKLNEQGPRSLDASERAYLERLGPRE